MGIYQGQSYQQTYITLSYKSFNISKPASQSSLWSKLRLPVAQAVLLSYISSLQTWTNANPDVASEILEVLLATKKHEVLILSRSVSCPLFFLYWLYRVLRYHRPNQSAMSLRGPPSSRSTTPTQSNLLTPSKAFTPCCLLSRRWRIRRLRSRSDSSMHQSRRA